MKLAHIIFPLVFAALAAAEEWRDPFKELAVPFNALLAPSAAVTRVRIEGMRGKSEQQVMELMGGRLTHVRNSAPSPPLADDAAFLLRQVLRKDGYADVEVGWRIPDGHTIVLSVRDGVRLSLGSVIVNGVPEDESKRLAKLYAKPAEKDLPILLGSPPFREEDVETGLSFIRQEFGSQGYWSAEAVVASRATDPATGKVDLVIEVKTGARHRIGNPVIHSADGRGVKLTANAVQPYVGRFATTKHLNAMRLAVEQLAISRGYPDAVIRMSRGGGEVSFVPVFDIDLGVRVKLREMRIAGLERTNPERIASRMAGMEGDWYDEDAVNKRLREFLSTGAFSAASVEMTEAGERLVDATLHFKEARAKEVSLAAGFGSYEGFIVRATYADRNLWGNLWGLNAGFEMSSRGLLGDVRVTDPWVLGSEVSATARAYALIYGREGYDTYDTGLEGSLAWDFGDHYHLELLAGSSVVNTYTDGLPSWALGETLYARPRLRLTQKVEFRDNPVLPKNGWHLQNPLEIGAAIGDISTTYVTTGLSGGWFKELGRNYQLGFGGDLGILVPGGDGEDLPIDLRLFNGGARSVRSFPERELGPTVEGYPVGGEAMWNTNAELMRDLGGPVKGVLFLDAGTLSREFDEIGSADVELAAGLGLRLNLPIGPVRLEYGYNLTRDSGEPTGTFHFAIGHAY